MPLSVDPHAPHWLTQWLRRAFLDRGLDDVPADRADLGAWLAAPTDDANVAGRALLAWLAALARPRLPATSDGPSAEQTATDRAAALRFARCLAWLTGRESAADALARAQERHRRGIVESAATRRGLDAALDEVGRALCARISDGVDGWLAAGTLATLVGPERRAIALLWPLATPTVPDAMRDDAAQQVDDVLAGLSYERMSILEAVVGLVRADDVVDGRERRLLEATMRASGVDPGEARLLRRMTQAGGADLDGLASALPDTAGQQQLLTLLEVAAHADGVADARESAWIDAVGDALAAPPSLRLAAHAAVVARLAGGDAVADALGRLPLGDASSRRAERQVRALVARHLRAIVRELGETGDLMVLLAASTTRPLSTDEQKRMRSQLLDLCRTVPALAIFAAPGGMLLLPILARVLPFSLTPSSFRDDGL